MKFIAIGLGIYAAVVIPAAILIHGCAHVFPSGCQPGQQLQDADHRVFGVNDCYACDEGVAGAVNEAGRYRCRDYTCNECEAPPIPGMFGAHAHDGGTKP